MKQLDWGLIRSFLAVADTGSLSAAARQLEVSQPTLTREIQALESSTGLNLFTRTTRGVKLTEDGATLVDAASHMGEHADRFLRQAAGLTEEIDGDVRLSVNEIVGYYMLPAAIAAFHEQHPGIQVEIVISNFASNLRRRDADVALRMFRPRQGDLVARRLPNLELGFYAHRDYIDKHGAPTDFPEMIQHTILGFDEDTSFIEGAAHMGYQFRRDHFAVRTDHLLTHINMIRAGVGIGVTHTGLVPHFPGLVRILEDIPLPPLEFWCVCHQDVQFNPRIRALMQFLIDWFDKDPYENTLV